MQQDSSRPRIDWYQTDAYVAISLFVKNAVAETASAAVSDTKSIRVSYELPQDNNERVLQCIDLQLSHAIVADSVRVSVKPSRLDIRADKLEPGIRWHVLEGNDSGVAERLAAPQQSAAGDAAAAASVATNAESRPAVKQKNWDAIAKSIEDEKLEGDAALNDLFQKIYQDGSDEQKKAMIKSFTESGGTVLSTNWGEVAKSKVDVKPPDGMEYRKWDG